MHKTKNTASFIDIWDYLAPPCSLSLEKFTNQDRLHNAYQSILVIQNQMDLKDFLISFERAIFQTFWKVHCITKSLFFKLGR